MRYRERAPVAALAPWVRRVWVLEGRLDEPEADFVLPDGCPELLFHAGDRFEARHAAAGWARQPGAALVGQIRGRLELRTPRVVRTLGVRFEPDGLWPFLGDASQVSGRLETPETLWGAAGARLCERVGEAADPDAAAARVESFLLARLGAVRGADATRRVGLAIGRLAGSGGRARIGDVATEVGWSRRELERRFLERVGLPPKSYASIVRVQGVLAAWRRPGARTLGDVAAACGYHDQSHLTREFRRVTGTTPARLLGAEPALAALFAES